MTTLQLGTDLSRRIRSKRSWLKPEPLTSCERIPLSFLVSGNCPLISNMVWCRSAFMDTPHHKGAINITVKEIDHHNFTNPWMKSCSIAFTGPRGQHIHPSRIGIIVIAPAPPSCVWSSARVNIKRTLIRPQAST